MKNRTIPELLQVLLDNEIHFKTGLCRLTGDIRDFGVLTRDEERVLDYYIMRNGPIRFDVDGNELNYRFKIGEWPPRKEWLEKQIEYSKNIES